MATSTTFRIDDSSPLILYDTLAQWGEGSPAGDNLASQYFGNNTFRLTTTFGASASFDFNGTSITIGGAKRGNHGPYQVILDGQVSNLNGNADPPVFQTALFQASGLTQGYHNVKIINQPTDNNSAFLDIDFIEWRTDVHGTQTRTIEDADPSFVYSPATAWTTDTTSTPGYSSGNGHFTNAGKASVTFTFEGDTLELIGSVGPDHGLYTANLNGNTRTLNATHGTYQPDQTLYFADGLGPGKHQLTVTSSSGKLGIDCAKVTEYNGKQPQSVNIPVIVGIAVGGVVALVLIVLGFFFWRRKQRRRSAHVTAGPILSDSPPIGGMPPMYQTNDGPGSYYPGSQVTVADPYAVMPGTSTTSYAHSTFSASRQSRPDLPDSYPYAGAPQPLPLAGPSTYSLPQPMASVYSPPVVQRSASDPPFPNEKDPNRMYVQGREQDAGPAFLPDPPSIARLPPDYSQATEIDGPPPRRVNGKF